MEKLFYIRETYYDSPREDCNGYYYSIIEFYNRSTAIKAYIDYIENNTEPVGFSCNFDIPLSIRIKHGLESYRVKRNGRTIENFDFLEDAVKYRDKENKIALFFRRHGEKCEFSQPCKIYIV